LMHNLEYLRVQFFISFWRIYIVSERSNPDG
jgi:hypothetical protein